MAIGDQWPGPGPWNVYGPYMPGSYKVRRSRPRVAGAPDFGSQLAAALGFDGKMVKSIDLHVAAGDIVTAKVEVIVTESQAVDIRDIFTKRVKLEPKVVGEEML